MRTVIYDPEDFEPLTVIDIPQHFINEINEGKRGDTLRFAIPEEPQFVPQAYPPSVSSMKVAEVRFEMLRYRGKVQWLVFAMNPEICLLLKSEFLAGQQREVQHREKQSRAAGFLQGLFAAME